MLKAKDIMTHNVHSVTLETEVEELARLFVEKRVSAMPVLDSGGRLQGIVTETDMLQALTSVLGKISGPPQLTTKTPTWGGKLVQRWLTSQSPPGGVSDSRLERGPSLQGRMDRVIEPLF